MIFEKRVRLAGGVDKNNKIGLADFIVFVVGGRDRPHFSLQL